MNGWKVITVTLYKLHPFVLNIFVPENFDRERISNEVVYLTNIAPAHLTGWQKAFQVQERLQTFVLIVYT